MHHSSASISAGELARELLAGGSIDPVIDVMGRDRREMPVLEYKGVYKDADCSAVMRWHVVKAVIALANADGGCVIVGLDDDGRTPVPWKPDLAKDDPEEKDYFQHARTELFNGQYRDESGRTISIPAPVLEGLRRETSVTFTLCRSSRIPDAEFLVLAVMPTDEPFLCMRTLKTHDVILAKGGQEKVVKESSTEENILFYRSREAAEVLSISTHDPSQNFSARYNEYLRNRSPRKDAYRERLNAYRGRSTSASAVGSFSTVPAPSRHFIGRETELESLREICNRGKIPLIHAAGGTGKTQLAYRYAQEHATEYPGGMFLVPMEFAADWPSAFQSLCDQRITASGTTPKQWLGIERGEANTADTEAEDTKKPAKRDDLTPESVMARTINALVRKCVDAGPVLLLLDNLEDPVRFLSDEALGKVFPQGLPKEIHLLATARTSTGITTRRCPHVETVTLEDLPPDDAIRLLVGEDAALDVREREAAADIVRLLGCRALFVGRVANLAAEYENRPFARLLRRIEHDKLEVTCPLDGEDDTRVPEVIWAWTREKLERASGGIMDVQLARTIALFPPDGVPLRIIEALWFSDFGRLDAQATLDAYRDDSDLFADALKRLAAFRLVQKDKSSEQLSMHRLDRAAIRKEIGADFDGCAWLERIGPALRACPCCSPDDWFMLAQAQSKLLAFCPWNLQDGRHCAEILSECPESRTAPIPWSRMTVWDWWILCSKRPEFYDKSQEFAVPASPLLAKEDPERVRHFNLDDFCGAAWADLLSNVPELAERCPFQRLAKNDWLLLLSHRPEMLKFCLHPEILNCAGQKVANRHEEVVSYWDRARWGELLAAQPGFADTCDWDSLTLADVLSIFQHAPQFAQRCPKRVIERIPGHLWTKLVLKHPELLSLYPAEQFPRPWAKHESHPVDFDPFSDSLNLNDVDFGLDWPEVLKKNPDLEDRCPFAQLPTLVWCRLLLRNRGYRRFNPPWEQIGPLATAKISHWSPFGNRRKKEMPFYGLLDFEELAAYRPADYVPFDKREEEIARQQQEILEWHRREDVRRELRSSNIVSFVAYQPRLSWIQEIDPAAYKPDELSEIYRRQPQIPSTLKWPPFPCAFSPFFSGEVCRFLLDLPEGLDFKYTYPLATQLPDGSDGECTETADHLEDASLALTDVPADSADLRTLALENRLTEKTKRSLGNPVECALLVCFYPQLAESPHIDWTKFAGRELCLIMLNRPTLEKYCDWSKFSGHNWAVLLAKNPEFAPKCDWSKFSEDDWAYLHADRPWMTADPATW